MGRLLNDEEAIDKLEIPALNKGRVPQYLKANMLAAKTITDRPVFAGCIGLTHWQDVCMTCLKS